MVRPYLVEPLSVYGRLIEYLKKLVVDANQMIYFLNGLINVEETIYKN